MAIELKQKREKGLFGDKIWFFKDASRNGKIYKTPPHVFEGCNSIEEAEFLADLAAAPNAEAFLARSTYSRKKEALALLPDSPEKEKYIKSVETAEFESRKEDTVSAFVDLAKKGNAEKGDFDHKKMADLIDMELIEFPAEISEDSRIQDSAGYAFLMEIIGKSTDAIVRRYQSALYTTDNPTVQAQIMKNYETNTKLFSSELTVCVETLLAKKIEALAEEIRKTDAETAEMKTKIAELTALAKEHRKKAGEAQVVIDRFKQSMRDAKKAKDGAVGASISEKMEEVVTKTGKLGESTTTHAETAEKLMDQKAYTEAMSQILAGLNEKAKQMLFRKMALSDIDVPEAELVEFLTTGKIPASLGLKNPTPKEVSKMFNKIIAEAKKLKAEILAKTAESEAEAELGK